MGRRQRESPEQLRVGVARAVPIDAFVVVVRRRGVTLHVGLDVPTRGELPRAQLLLLRARVHRRLRAVALEVRRRAPRLVPWVRRVRGVQSLVERPPAVGAAVRDSHVLAGCVNCFVGGQQYARGFLRRRHGMGATTRSEAPRRGFAEAFAQISTEPSHDVSVESCVRRVRYDMSEWRAAVIYSAAPELPSRDRVPAFDPVRIQTFCSHPSRNFMMPSGVWCHAHPHKADSHVYLLVIKIDGDGLGCIQEQSFTHN